MARLNFSQIFKPTATCLRGDERSDFAAVETLLGSQVEDEAASSQQTQVAMERLLRRWKLATYATTFILCFLLITLLSVLRQRDGHPVQQIFCEPASLNVDKAVDEADLAQHPQKPQLSLKRWCSTTTFTKIERHIKDLRRMKWTKPGMISIAVCRADLVVLSHPDRSNRHRHRTDRRKRRFTSSQPYPDYSRRRRPLCCRHRGVSSTSLPGKYRTNPFGVILALT